MKIRFEGLRQADFTIECSLELGEECLSACINIAEKRSKLLNVNVNSKCKSALSRLRERN